LIPDEGEDVLEGGRLVAQRVGLVLIGRPVDLGHEDGDGVQRNLDNTIQMKFKI
jgi:hypothetical protein